MLAIGALGRESEQLPFTVFSPDPCQPGSKVLSPFKQRDGRYELTPDSLSSLPQALSGAVMVLNSTPFRDLHNVHSTICLSDRSLREHFENGDRKAKLEDIPKPEEYEMGEVIVLFDEIILRREEDYTHTPLWRIIPKEGEKLSEVELSVLEEKLNLREKAPAMESHAHPITAKTLSSERTATQTIINKLEDPKTTNRKEFNIPDTDVTLYIRNHQGNRVWVALPRNGERLSLHERKVIETYLGHKIRYKKISEDDVICFGPGWEKYFRKNNPSLPNENRSNKFPNLDKYEGDVFIPRGEIWKPLIFEIKTNEKKEKVWTAHKDHCELAERYLGRLRSQCPYIIKMPDDAVILTGKGSEKFWEGINTIEHDQYIARDFIDPYGLGFASITFKNQHGKCPVFLGENDGEYFLWVYRGQYSTIAEIVDLCPTDPNLKRITRLDFDKLDLLRRNAVRDSRIDDGTEEFALSRSLPRRGDRVF